MLVLSRKKNEVIIIGEGPNQIELMVVDIRGDKVRLGIKAPTEIPIHRAEVRKAIRQESAGECAEQKRLEQLKRLQTPT